MTKTRRPAGPKGDAGSEEEEALKAVRILRYFRQAGGQEYLGFRISEREVRSDMLHGLDIGFLRT